MQTQAIRRAFVDFFAARGHTPVPSASLIPVDPTLLLTAAGMVPFKPYFLGEQTPPFARAVSVQKCARTTDIDVVGTTDSHLTFFEMLGNFSFGDYFKSEAIGWAQELVVEVLGLDPDRLWYTVYKTDDEAAEIWTRQVGIPPHRVQRGDRDNFWQMGVPGPCGPCSEIFYDRGERYGAGGGPIGGSAKRYVEIWNLVFMQNIQDVPYHVIGDLPAKNIDTGAGLDRVAMVVQQAESVFEADGLRALLTSAEEVTRTAYRSNPTTDVSLRILSDHGRALTFLFGDGVVPSNEGRGYVLRRLLRRAVRHAWQLGARELVIPPLVETTVELMGSAYPNLVTSKHHILASASREEERFRRTLESGHSLLDVELEAMTSDVLTGPVAFKLHDTYGFPIELTREIAAERGKQVDMHGFESEMAFQRQRARQAWRGGDMARLGDLYRKVMEQAGPTQFVGYQQAESAGRILSMVREGEVVERAEAGQKVEVFLDCTPFYAESGGQVGDRGVIQSPTGQLSVSDTRSGLPGLHGHWAKVETGTVEIGQDVTASIDTVRRDQIRTSHTGTHILHWAIRQVVGEHANQAGSLVEAGRLRFDFSHHGAPNPEELLEIERLANQRVIEDAEVHAFQTSRQEAAALGALAFFGEKYGEVVRVVELGGFSRELCGGTHVTATGQVGPLVLTHEGSIGANLRRVEALSGISGYQYLIGLREELRATAALLSTRPDKVRRSVQGLLTKAEEREERLARFEERQRSTVAGQLAERAESVGSSRLVAASLDEELAPDALRALALGVRQQLGRGVVVLAARRDGKGALVAAVDRELVAAGVAAGELVREAASLLGGGGSRDPELAQAGGPHGDRLEEALLVARDAARAALGSI